MFCALKILIMLCSGQSERYTCKSWKILGYTGCALTPECNLEVILLAIIMISICVYVRLSMCVPVCVHLCVCVRARTCI